VIYPRVIVIFCGFVKSQIRQTHTRNNPSPAALFHPLSAT